MADRVLVLTCNYHFGDNLGVFEGACFVGLRLQLPVVVSWISDDPSTAEVFLFIETHDVETWDPQGWRGHAVFINDTEIGRLKDPVDVAGRNETFKLGIDKETLRGLVGPTGNATLSVVLERQPKHPTLVDDFVLTRVETVDMAMRVGSA